MKLSKDDYELIHYEYSVLLKSVEYLEESFIQCKNIQIINFDELNSQDKINIEALTSRFARTSDIFLKKFLKSLAAVEFLEYQSLRDLIHIAEKKNWIESADIWIKIRQLRNTIAHEYTINDRKEIFQLTINFSPYIINDSRQLENYIKQYHY